MQGVVQRLVYNTTVLNDLGASRSSYSVRVGPLTGSAWVLATAHADLDPNGTVHMITHRALQDHVMESQLQSTIVATTLVAISILSALTELVTAS